MSDLASGDARNNFSCKTERDRKKERERERDREEGEEGPFMNYENGHDISHRRNDIRNDCICAGHRGLASLASRSPRDTVTSAAGNCT